jgi:hypothetical protein
MTAPDAWWITYRTFVRTIFDTPGSASPLGVLEGWQRLLTIPRRQLQCGPDSPPDGLARYAVSQRLNDGALAQRGEAVLRCPHAKVARTEM